MYRLHFAPGYSSMAPHMVLRLIGCPFECIPVDLAHGENQGASFLALNPLGRIPVLQDGTLVLTEAAAICLHLADKHPGAGLVPPLGSAQRADVYRWLFYLSNTLQAEMFCWFYPERHADDPAAVDSVKAHAKTRIAGMFDHLALHLSKGGPYLCGKDLSVADPFLLMLAYWALDMQRPARAVPHLGPYLERLAQLPAVTATFQAEGLAQPWF